MDLGSYPNDLIKAEEDEEGFDLLNEETFGDLGTCGDDWENEHEFFRRVKLDVSNYEDPNEDDFDENDVENQLSKLVSEEVDDDDDGVNRSNAFMKPYDMWSDSHDFIRSSQDDASNGFRDSNYVSARDDSLHSASREDKMNGQFLARKGAMTVEELERMLLTEREVPSQNMSHLQSFPVQSTNYQVPPFKQIQPVMSVHQQGPRVAPMFPLSRTHLIQQQHMQQMHHYNQQLQRHLNHGIPQHLNHPTMLPQRATMLPQHAGMLSQHPGMIPAAHLYPPNPAQGLLMASHQYQHRMIPQQQILAQCQHMLQHHQMLVRRHLQQQQQQHLHPLHQQPKQQQFPLHLQQQFQQRQMSTMMAEQGRAANMNMYSLHNPHHPFLHHQPQPHHHTTGSKREIERREMREYDGLMDQREKDWIIKIQFRQLHTDNPYVDDYYFTCWSMKKLMRDNVKRKQQLKKMERENGVQEGDKLSDLNDDCDDEEDDDDDVPTLLVPQLAKSEAKQYTPVQYEGSLGKLTASSIHNPRQVIDVHLSSAAEEAKKHDSKKLRELLCKIEKSFDILLEVDDLEKKALAQPEEHKLKYYEDRKELISLLSKRLLSDNAHFLQQAVSIRKGMVLIIRLLPLVIETGVASEMIKKLVEKLVGTLKKDWSDEVSPSLYHSVSPIILDCSFLDLIHMSEALCRNIKGEVLNSHVTQILQSQIGLSLVLLLMDRAEILLQGACDDNVVSPSTILKWRNFVQLVTRCLASVDGSSLRRPFKNKSSKDRSHAGRYFVDCLKRFATDSWDDYDQIVGILGDMMDVLSKVT